MKTTGMVVALIVAAFLWYNLGIVRSFFHTAATPVRQYLRGDRKPPTIIPQIKVPEGHGKLDRSAPPKGDPGDSTPVGPDPGMSRSPDPDRVGSRGAGGIDPGYRIAVPVDPGQLLAPAREPKNLLPSRSKGHSKQRIRSGAYAVGVQAARGL